jgi:hypothetical protein
MKLILQNLIKSIDSPSVSTIFQLDWNFWQCGIFCFSFYS